MRPEDMILISVDDHVVEPPDLFQHHLTPEWKDRAPRVVRRKDGTDVWVFEGQQLLNIGLNAVAGRPPEEYGVEPTSFEQLRPGCYDVGERVHDMNANGVLASLCFPSFPSFCGALWARTEDKQLAITMLRAYNDWHIDEWCGGAPGRFVPLALPVMWDAEACAEEVRRVARKGCHALSFTENPEKIGFPSLHDPHWDPLWQACCDEGTIVCIHIGSTAGMQFTTMDSPVDVMITVSPISIVSCAADLVWSQVLRRFPALKFALSEGGIGWVPYFLERIDYVHRHHHRWTHQEFGSKKPSDLFREHIITCFIDDPIGVKLRHEVGIETITWECDYPHSDTTWPTAPEQLSRSLEGVPDDEVDSITWQNAAREFRFDPFAHRTREACTVSALRAESPDVDLGLKSQGGRAPIDGEARPVTAKDITSQLAQLYAAPAE